jgi:transposase
MLGWVITYPSEYGLATTIYNRFNRWSRRRIWIGIPEALAATGALSRSASIDSAYVKSTPICSWRKRAAKALVASPCLKGVYETGTHGDTSCDRVPMHFNG